MVEYICNKCGNLGTVIDSENIKVNDFFINEKIVGCHECGNFWIEREGKKTNIQKDDK